MHAGRSYQKNEIPQYVKGLLECGDRKVCTNLAKTLNVSHDKVYKDFERSILMKNVSLDALKIMAQRELDVDNVHLVIDDSLLTKLYAKEIEGLEIGFDGSSGRPCLGIRMITSLLTDGNTSIPIESLPYVGRALAQGFYKSKSQLGIEIVEKVAEFIKIKRLLADAHFATNETLKFLHEHHVNFLMKISRSRLVKINQEQGQLQKIFRLKKNNHTAVKQGTLNDINCFFYAIKLETRSVVYLISSDYIDPRKAITLYRTRWKIEVFHRTAKQYLGLSDCQMIAIEKQHQHAIYVMHAYAIASVRASRMGLSCVEDYINHVRVVKTEKHKTIN